MKKIVALVLSLVMVLGLATTAFAVSAPTVTWSDLEGTYDVVSVDDTDGEVDADYAGAAIEVSNAKAPKDTSDPKDGKVDVYGWVKGFHVEYTNGVEEYFVQVPTLAAADYVVYYAGTETKLGYFVSVGTAEAALYYLGTPAKFDNFGDDCLQLDIEPEEDTVYYIFEGAVYAETTWALATSDAVNFMVANELVPAEPVAAATSADWVVHSPVFTYDKDYKVVAVKCDECDAAAVIYENLASVPKADKAVDNVFPINGGDDFYCWTAAKAPAADDDKVESAETFDAGIAMYVGMSVMAAAGSAVVLKKKD